MFFCSTWQSLKHTYCLFEAFQLTLKLTADDDADDDDDDDDDDNDDDK